MRVLLAIVALAVSCLCISNPPVANGGKDLQMQDVKSVSDKAQTNIRVQGTRELPIVIETVVAAKTQAEIDHQNYERHEKPTLDRWLTWATVALAGITGVLAYFTYGLWSEGKNSTEIELRAYVMATSFHVVPINDDLRKLKTGLT